MPNRSVLDWPHGVSMYEPARCYNGFTLVHGRGNWDPTHAQPIEQLDSWHLIDMKGRIVNRWTANPLLKKGTALFERLANGNYVVNGPHVLEQQWNGDIVSSIPVDFLNDGRRTAHHDVQKTDEGNYLYGVNRMVEAPEISRVPI